MKRKEKALPRMATGFVHRSALSSMKKKAAVGNTKKKAASMAAAVVHEKVFYVFF